MRIGIFETDHFEGAYPVIKLFDNGSNDITVFTYKESYRQFEYLFKDNLTRYKWIIKDDSRSKYLFIYQIYKTAKTNQFDILYLNTITDNHLVYAIMIAALRKARIVMTIHDVNSHFQLEKPFSFRKVVRYVGKRCLVRILNEFNVVSSTMVSYLRNKLPRHKNVHCVPGSVFETSNLPDIDLAIKDQIKIVIPGTLDARRRNYEFVFGLLEKINQGNLNVTITLLGGVNGRHGTHIVEKCKKYSIGNDNLHFFNQNVVDQPEFDRIMNESHIAFIPSTINTIIADDVPETYGVSISSGNLFDIIKHAKPCIIPLHLQLPDNIQSSCIKYTTVEDIVNFLKSLFANPEDYRALKEQAFKNSQQYTIEKVRQNNASLFIERN
jgi:hypothetical protein